MGFSIITVCLNAGDDLPRTVRSVLNQTYSDFEIIVKDGGSTDGSLDRLPADPRIRIVREPDTGIYDAMNQAVQYAEKPYCIFLNAGDLLFEETTLEKIAAFAQDRPADVYYGKSRNLAAGTVYYAPEIIDEYYCYRTGMCHQAMIFRTERLKERGYDLEFRVSADREWTVYAAVEAKLKFVRLPFFVSDYKGGGFSSTREALAAVDRENRLIVRRHFSRGRRLRYGFRYAFTLPRLRKWISRNPKLEKFYFALSYRYKSREKKH